jgi:hypothetical protein
MTKPVSARDLASEDVFPSEYHSTPVQGAMVMD